MDIRQVKFIKSSPDAASCPAAGPPEYAFAGRSNVGKSSLLNLLTNVHNLAKTSSTPGKTKLINHYLVNDTWYLVDLPGYGFARAGKKTRDTFLSNIGDYLLKRKTLACLFILIDCRHQPLLNDLEFIHWAGIHQIPLALVFTKADKLSATMLAKSLDRYRNTLRQSWEELPPIFAVSALKRTGKEALLEFIGRCNASFFVNTPRL
jgi:GTP-binding protein